MGQRGPAPQPTALKLLQGKTVDHNEARPREAVPSPPDWLPDAVLDVWDRVLPELKYMKVITAADTDALVTYCMAVVHHRDACLLVARDGMLVRGHMGEMVKNPAMQFVERNAVLIKVMARELGLTPAARVGLTAGEQDAPSAAERLLS